MDIVITETGSKKIFVKINGDRLYLTVDRGGWYQPKRTIDLSKRQVKKLVSDIQSILDNNYLK
jgi:hypothetical protein